MKHNLTNENYHSLENNMKYFSVSQIKDFMKCQEMAVAKIRGDYKMETTSALLVGSFVDAHFSNEMALFKAQTPDIFTRNGDLKSDYKQAEYIIARIESDRMFMEHISGQMQVIQVGMIMGFPVKIKIDSLHPDKIVDLKIMRDFEAVWTDGTYKSFVEAWQYDIQGAIYQEVERQNRGEYSDQLPFILAAATKEKETDLALIGINQTQLNYQYTVVRDSIKRFAEIKQGLVAPSRCGKCDWCKRTKIITEVIDYELIGG